MKAKRKMTCATFAIKVIIIPYTGLTIRMTRTVKVTTLTAKARKGRMTIVRTYGASSPKIFILRCHHHQHDDDYDDFDGDDQ